MTVSERTILVLILSFGTSLSSRRCASIVPVLPPRWQRGLQWLGAVPRHRAWPCGSPCYQPSRPFHCHHPRLIFVPLVLHLCLQPRRPCWLWLFVTVRVRHGFIWTWLCGLVRNCEKPSHFLCVEGASLEGQRFIIVSNFYYFDSTVILGGSM